MALFAGRSNPELAKNIADYIGQPLGVIDIKNFSDGEVWVKYRENIRGKDVFLIQSTNSPAENILELVLMIDAAVRASADRVTVVIPYFGYSRQDRKDTPRVPISARVMVDLFTATGADRIISMDLHSTQTQGFAKIPFDHLFSRIVLLDKLKNIGLNPETSTVLSPDMGSVQMSQSYAKHLGMHFALIDKRRYAPNKAEVAHLIGDLEGKDVLIIDDMIDTAGTIVNAASEAIQNGAKSVTVAATHAILSGEAVSRLDQSVISKFIFTDTIQIPQEKQLCDMEVVSVSEVFGEAIKRIHNSDSVSSLFKF